jgi:hypothetical protein
MTIIEAISRADALKPNVYSQEEKIKWLSALDGIVKYEIIDTHEGGEGVLYGGYDGASDPNTVLLIPAPYDEVYVHYLAMHIDYANAEFGKYNNSLAMYNTAYAAFERWYNRMNLPKGKKFRFS